MSDAVNRFLGDTPGRTAIKLVILCVVVGFVMTTLGISPWDLLHWVRRFFIDLWRSGFDALGRIGDYLLVGAAVVVPVFIILRIMNWRKS
jgi:hypothetical protein